VNNQRERYRSTSCSLSIFIVLENIRDGESTHIYGGDYPMGMPLGISDMLHSINPVFVLPMLICLFKTPQKPSGDYARTYFPRQNWVPSPCSLETIPNRPGAVRVYSTMGKKRKGKPVERQGRKAMGLQAPNYTNDCQAAESLSESPSTQLYSERCRPRRP
jgi:hypothetical protein